MGFANDLTRTSNLGCSPGAGLDVDRTQADEAPTAQGTLELRLRFDSRPQFTLLQHQCELGKNPLAFLLPL
jgi:hypothetical protein